MATKCINGIRVKLTEAEEQERERFAASQQEEQQLAAEALATKKVQLKRVLKTMGITKEDFALLVEMNGGNSDA